MKATILAVGTELTTGQITNKNASWISKELSIFGIETVAHLTVPDDKKIITETLNYCESFTDLVIVTGGLGPTSDDFTRDLISDWIGQKLVFNEEAWTYVQQRLTSRGFTVKDIQRQQCYFPEGSFILTNSHGTAHGFLCFKIKQGETEQKKIPVIVLPGPPREIEAIWKDHLIEWFPKNVGSIDKKITKSWDTIGVGESDVALLVEKALQGRSENFPMDVGYRVHLPYVEVKLTFPESASYTSMMFVQNVDKALSSITVLKDFSEITDQLSELIQDTPFAFYDFVSGGFLHHRLSPQLKKVRHWMWKDLKPSSQQNQNGETDDIPSSDFFDEEQNFLALLPLSEFEAFIYFDYQGRRKQIRIEAPMKSPLMKERRLQYFAEMAMIEFVRAHNQTKILK